MVFGAKPVRFDEKFIPLKLVEGTAVPEPLGNPFIKLYSTPYAVIAEHPFAGIVPATVAETVVIADAAPDAPV